MYDNHPLIVRSCGVLAHLHNKLNGNLSLKASSGFVSSVSQQLSGPTVSHAEQTQRLISVGLYVKKGIAL